MILSTPFKNDYTVQNGKQRPQTLNLNFFNFRLLQPQTFQLQISWVFNFSNFNPLQLQSSSFSNFINLEFLQLQTSSSKTSSTFSSKSFFSFKLLWLQTSSTLSVSKIKLNFKPQLQLSLAQLSPSLFFLNILPFSASVSYITHS